MKAKLTCAIGRDHQSEMTELGIEADRLSENLAENNILEAPPPDALHFLRVVPRVSGVLAEVPVRVPVAVPDPDQIILLPGVPLEGRVGIVQLGLNE